MFLLAFISGGACAGYLQNQVNGSTANHGYQGFGFRVLLRLAIESISPPIDMKPKSVLQEIQFKKNMAVWVPC